MKIKIDKPAKIELLNALRSGILDTEKIQAIQTVLNEVRPDLKFAEMSDEELDARITELENKMKK